jgi:hypothetical protein
MRSNSGILVEPSFQSGNPLIASRRELRSSGPEIHNPTYTEVEIHTKAGFLGNMAVNSVSNYLQVEAPASKSSARKDQHLARNRNTKFPHDRHVSSEFSGTDRGLQATAEAKSSRFWISDLRPQEFVGLRISLVSA